MERLKKRRRGHRKTMGNEIETDRSVALTIIIPVFNEEGNILLLHERLTKTLQELGQTYELLFIDDGSRDGSFERLKALYGQDPTVRVVRFVRNFGQQTAVTAGFRYARGKSVVLIDADLQTQPEEIPLLLQKLEDGFDIVYGVRQRRRDPIWRRVGSWAMSHILFRITGIDIPDSASGFIAMDRRLVDSINLYQEKSRYLSGHFAWLSYGRWASIPVTHAARTAGQTKYSLAKLVELTLNFVCNFTTTPLRFASFAGGALFSLSLLVFLGLMLTRLAQWSGRTPVWEVAVLIAAMGVFTGFQLLFTGILGEYVARIFTEVKQRPPFAVREILDHAKEESSSSD